MPIAGLGLHILVAIFFAAHAIRTRQDRYWLWILFGASEAVTQYQAVLSGIYANDARIQVRLADALLAAGRADEARALLERLIAEQPDFKSPEGHLLYARSLAALGERGKAREEFNVLTGYFVGLEARARYAGILMEWGDRERAHLLIDESLKQAKRMPRYARDMNKPWLTELKRIEAQLRL
jgi:hypothetical protein